MICKVEFTVGCYSSNNHVVTAIVMEYWPTVETGASGLNHLAPDVTHAHLTPTALALPSRPLAAFIS
jgi:hypothetical protein